MNKEEERTGAPVLKRPDKLQQIEENPVNCIMSLYSPELDKLVYNTSATYMNKAVETVYAQMTLDEIKPICIENSEGDQLYIDYSGLEDGLKESAKKLLLYMTAIFTYQNSKQKSGNLDKAVKFSIEEYANICGRDISTPTKRKEFGRSINYDITAIRGMSAKLSFKGAKGTTDIVQADLDTGRGVYGILFSDLYAQYLIGKGLITPIPNALFAIDNARNKSPIAFPLGYYLCEHYNMDSNRASGRHDIISIKAILNRFSTYFPAAESAERNRHRQRIIETLEKALGILEDMRIITWEYCGAKKAPADEPANFIEFEKLYIKYDVINAPDGTERRKSNAARRKALAERKRKAISRSKNAKAKNGTTTENSAPADGDQSGAQ